MCAARSCLGTEVTGGSCIARVGFVCRKEEKNQGDPHSSSSSSASRSCPAIASDKTSSRTSDSRCNRIEMMSLAVVNLREKKRTEKKRGADLFRMAEHHDLEKFDVLRRPEENIAWRRWRRVVVVGGEDGKAKFPNGRPFDVLAPREQAERASGERKITALY